MTVNGAICVIESLDRPTATGLVFAASLFDFSPNNTIALPENLWHRIVRCRHPWRLLLTHSSEHAKTDIPA